MGSAPGVHVDDGELIDLLTEQALARLEAGTPWAQVPEVERVVYAVNTLVFDVNNGGFDQYFYNSYSDCAATALEALERLGAATTARLLRDAMEAFGPDGPPADRAERQERLEEIRDGAEARWTKLEDRFYEYPDDVLEMLREYARERAAH